MKFYKEIEEAFVPLNESHFGDMNDALKEPVFYAMQSGGKYFRPLLMAYATELFGASYKNSLSNAYGVELFHNFTLLHDDIMDNAALRRGKASVYKKYGLNAGILSGDLMLIKSLKITAEINEELNSEIYKLIHKTAIEIHEGQQMDVDFEGMETVKESEYIKMITYKTAVLIACSLKIGAIVAKTNALNKSLIYEFGILIGIAFQIQDDYLDTFGTAKVGKRIGGDIINNKKTLLYIMALNLANDDQRKALLKLYSTKKVKDEQEKINQVIRLFKETGAKDYCNKKMNGLHAEALEVLDIIKTKQSKKELHNIADLIISRDV